VASSAAARDPSVISAIRSLVMEVPAVNDGLTGDDHRLYIRLAASTVTPWDNPWAAFRTKALL
jgi:hypothetical protein